MNELYIVCDIETDGSIPSDSSMLTLGAVPVIVANDAIDIDFNNTFYVRLLPRVGAIGTKEVLEWWAKQEVAVRYEAFLAEPRLHPSAGIKEFQTWARELVIKHDVKRAVFVARPTGFDFMFVRWYMQHWLGSDEPFGHRALDLRSLWMGMTPGALFSELHSSEMDKKFDVVLRHVGKDMKLQQHNALDDAKHHAMVFAAMLQARNQEGK